MLRARAAYGDAAGSHDPRIPHVAKRTLIALVVLAGIWAVVSNTSPADERAPRSARPLSSSRVEAEPLAELPAPPRVDAPASPVPETAVPEAIPQLEEQAAGNLSVLVLDDLGEPVADVYVRAGTETPPWLGDQGRTGSDGRVRLDCPPARYILTVNRRSESNGTHGGAAFRDVQVEGEPVDIVAVIARNTAGVRLVARDGLGAPVVGLLVEARGPMPDPEPQRTDDRGEVTWSKLTPGPWRFSDASDDPTLSLRGQSDARVDLVADTVTTAEWTFERRAQVIVDLRAVPFLAELDGLLLDRTMLRPPWPDEVSWLVPPGTNTLWPRWSTDSASYSEPIEFVVAEGEVRRIPLVVETGALSVSGRVVDTRGLPIEGVPVSASIGEWNADRSVRRELAGKKVTTDASGAWSLRGLPRGELSALVQCRYVDGRHLDEAVRLGPNTTPEEAHIDFGDIVVTPAVRLVCELSESWLAHLRDNKQAELELFRVDPTPIYPGKTNQKTSASALPPGVHQFENVVPGEYLLRVWDQRDAVFASQTLHVPEGHAEGEPLHVRVGDGEPVFLTTR